MSERAFTEAELLQATATMRNSDKYAEAITAVLAEIDRQEEAKRALADKPAPAGIPEGFKWICVCKDGINRGLFTIYPGDRHVWLPPEEAVKNRPDLNQGVWPEKQA